MNYKVRAQARLLNHFYIFLFVFIFLNTMPVFAGPSRTTYQAKIIKPDGYPLEASNVNFKFTILDPAGSCILYSETYSAVNMSGTGGLISFALGSGVKTYPASATTFENIFSNVTASLSCDTGGPANYSPGGSDIRKIVMQFHDGSGWQTLPAMSINAVPYAMYANEATKLNGLTSSDFVQLSTVPTCAASEALRYTGAGFTCIAVGNNVTSGTVTTALGYTPADSVNLSTVSSTVAGVSAYASNVSSTVFSVSSTVTSLQNSVVASFAAITSSQWTASGTNIFYNTGNVGIGTDSPTAKLHIVGGQIDMDNSGSNTGINLYTESNIAAYAGYVAARRARGTSTAPLAVQNNDVIATFGGFGYSGSTYNQSAQIRIFAEGNHSVSSSPGAISFYTTSSGTTTTSERMRLTNLGYVGIGTTTPVTKLDVSGGVRIGVESTTCAPALAGTLRYNASNVEYCNGTSWQAFGVSGAGITNFNGSTSGTQSFATGTGGTTPNIVTANGVHTLNIPLASTGSVTAGLISNTDYTTFTNKITSSAASIAQVLGYVPADNAASGTYAQKANNLSDLTNIATARTNLGLGTFATASSMDLGSASATGTLAIARIPSFIGDATIAAASNTIILSNSGVTAGTYTKVTVDAKGRVTSSSSLVSTDVTTALGYTPASASASTQWTTSGSTIYYNTGNLGIGTSNPTYVMHINGNLDSSGNAYNSKLQIDGNAQKFATAAIYGDSTDSNFARSYLFMGTRNSNLASTGGGQGATIILNNYRWDGTNNIQNLAGDVIGELAFRGSTTSGYQNTAAIQVATASGTDAQMHFRIQNNSGATTGHPIRMTLNSVGNLGIGTSSPSQLLDVAGNSWLRSTTIIGSGGSLQPTLSRDSTTGGLVVATSGTGATGDFIYKGNDTAGNLTERFRIVGSGNVGIGTNTPTAGLHLAAGTSSNASLKLTSGTLLTSPQSGTIEYDGTNFYLTDSTNTRRAIAANTNPGTYDNVSSINSSSNITLTPTGSVIVSSTTASTNSSTGALIVKGGMGVAGDLNVAGTISGSAVIKATGYRANQGAPDAADSSTVGYAFGQDGDTGLFSPGSGAANGVLAFYSNNSEKMRITAGGSLGIGTSAPTTRLHVAGGIRSQGLMSSSEYNGLGGTFIDWDSVGNIGRIISSNASASSLALYTATSGSSTERVRIDFNGNVGIGTVSPGALLQIGENAVSSSAFRFVPSADQSSVRFTTNNLANWIQSGVDFSSDSKKDLRFSSINGATTWMTLQASSGNVGIGTTTPAAKFHVQTANTQSLEGVNISTTTNANDGIYLRPDTGAGNANPLAQAGDKAIIFSDGAVDTGNLVIGNWSNTATGMRITSAGNVGIGTASPTAKLHVAGSAQIDGEMSFGDYRAYLTDYTGGVQNKWRYFGTSTSNNGHIRVQGVLGGHDLATAQEGQMFIDLGFNARSGFKVYGSIYGKVSVANGNAIRIYKSADSLTFYYYIYYGSYTQYSLNVFGSGAGDVTSSQTATTVDPVSLGYTLVWNSADHVNNNGIAYFSGSASSASAVMTVSDSGNMGIGTTSASPRAKFEVNNGANSDGSILATSNESNRLVVKSWDTQPTDVQVFGVVHNFNGDENNGFLKFYRGGSTSGGFLTLGTSGAERMRIATSGNVGIGATSPDRSLEVSGTVEARDANTGGATDGAIRIKGNTSSGYYGGSYGTIQFVNQLGNTQWATIIGNSVGNLLLQANEGNVGIATTAPVARLDVAGATLLRGGASNTVAAPTYGGTYFSFDGATNTAGLWALNNTTSQFAFYTKTGNTDSGTERMRITDTGRVGIGTASPGYTLDVNGDLRITGTPYRNGGDIAWTVPSDSRLKDVVKNYDRGLREIASLDTIIFRYKKDNPKNIDSSKEYTGVLAQQVAEQIPEAVKKDEQGFLSLNTTPIFWAMVNAIKELYYRMVGVEDVVNDMKREVASVKAESTAKDQKIKELEERLQKIEKALKTK